MSQSLVFTLLMLALVLPLFGALVLRVLASRLAATQLYGAAALIFAVAVISVLALARSNISSLQVGGLSLLLPVSGPGDQNIPLPPLTVLPALDTPAPTVAGAPTSAPTRPAATAVLRPTQAPTLEPPTAIPPTAVPATEIPPTAAPTAAPSGPRTYIVQRGDTLRGIAEQFNVSVQAIIDANHLTPEQADSLRVGQELVIP